MLDSMTPCHLLPPFRRYRPISPLAGYGALKEAAAGL